MRKLHPINNFFSNIMKNLKVFEYYVEDKLSHSLSRNPTLKAILRFKTHLSIRIAKRFSRLFSSFIPRKLIKVPFLKKSEN